MGLEMEGLGTGLSAGGGVGTECGPLPVARCVSTGAAGWRWAVCNGGSVAVGTYQMWLS